MKLFITSNSNVGLRVAECSCQYFFSISCSYTNFSCQNTPTKTKMSTNRLFRAELCLSANSDQIYIYKYVYIYMRATHRTHNLLLFLLWISSFDQIHNNNHMKMRIKNINCVFFFSFFLCLFNLLVRLCYTVSVCWWYSYWWCWRWLPISALAHIHTLSHPFHSWLCFQPVQ